MIGVLGYAQDVTPRPPPGPLVVQTVPLDPARPERTRFGLLDYAGGLMLSAGGDSAFGGLSGLTVTPDSAGLTVTAVSDEGRIARFSALLDAQGRLADADGLIMADLHEDGKPLGRSKRRGDSEDIAVASGRTYVSLESDNRVLAFADPFDPAGAVKRMRLPQAAYGLDESQGLEALAAAEIGGKPILAFGAEDGRVWLCPRLAGSEPAPDCREITPRQQGLLYRLTALAHLTGSEDFLALYRAVDPARGWSARVVHLAATPRGYRSRTLATLQGPLTVDNMEGLAALPLPDGGGWRLYLLSDDNFRPQERTLLLAFDWRRP